MPVGLARRAEPNLGFDFELVATPEALASISHCILPGVGAFAVAMERLTQANMVGALQTFAATGKPMLGVCLGMQLLADSGDEGGGASGLGLIGGSVRRMPTSASLRVPHIGWNAVEATRKHPVFQFRNMQELHVTNGSKRCVTLILKTAGQLQNILLLRIMLCITCQRSCHS